ncbi:uncharacterized protein LOC142342300 [Convolutriloba macropyga]|uniref:uncharacterized protein LOC142342300 n=1 Tax=Convolutriloba macropyga TaxID=536237 RepID=UPI003F51D2ED
MSSCFKASAVVFIVNFILCSWSMRLIEWESLIFNLADPEGSSLNTKCTNLSYNFCTYGYFIRSRGPRTSLGFSDEAAFTITARNHYQSINWYSLDQLEFGGCCEYHKRLYDVEGRDKGGLTHFQYFSRMMDFYSSGKELNYIGVRSDGYGGNVISSIGFGKGCLTYLPVHRNGKIRFPPTRPFQLTPRNHGMFNSSYQLLHTVDFDWFKRYVVCFERPWICSHFGPKIPIVDYVLS